MTILVALIVLIKNDGQMPIKIITGYSDFFVEKVKYYANKYELGCYPETPDNEGCWVFFLDDWKKVPKK